MRIALGARCTIASLVVAAAAVIPAAPAAATGVEQQCHYVPVHTAAAGSYRARVCVGADTGLYEPVYVECNTFYGCWARVTVGHRGSGEFNGTICVEKIGTAPACAGLGPADVELVYVEPQYMCVNDSPWGPPCDPREVDEQY